MVCTLLANYHFQMGVTVMGFAEHFGQRKKSNFLLNLIFLFFSKKKESVLQYNKVLIESPASKVSCSFLLALITTEYKENIPKCIVRG